MLCSSLIIIVVYSLCADAAYGHLLCYYSNQNNVKKSDIMKQNFQIHNCSQKFTSLPNDSSPICYMKTISFPKEDSNTEPQTDLGCYLKNNSIDDLCEFFKVQLYEEGHILSYCTTCTESLCNSFSSSQPKEENNLNEVSPDVRLTCFECEAVIGTNNVCEVRPRNVPTQRCTPGFLCNTYVLIDKNVSSVHRGCGEKSKCKELSAKSLNKLKSRLETCETCETNFCNLSTKNAFSFVTMCMGLISVYFYKQF